MKLREAYQEWCNCGNKGTMLEWALKVGVKLEEVEEKEDAEKR